MDDEVGDLREPLPARAERGLRFAGISAELLGEAPRGREAHEAGVGGLALGLVLARGLAERGGVALLVEDVVDYLKGEADAFGVAVEVPELRGRDLGAAMRADEHRRANQRARLDDVHVLELGERERLAHGVQVDRLAAS